MILASVILIIIAVALIIYSQLRKTSNNDVVIKSTKVKSSVPQKVYSPEYVEKNLARKKKVLKAVSEEENNVIISMEIGTDPINTVEPELPVVKRKATRKSKVNKEEKV